MGGRRNRYNYQEYRGRGGRARPVLIFIVVLLAVLLAAGVAFMYFMGDYIKYTDTGMEIDLPWLNTRTSEPPEISDPVIVESEPVIVSVEPTPEPTPAPTPGPEYRPLAALTVKADQLRDGSAAQVVANAGANALVVEMKSIYGKLAWQSQTETAAALSVNAADNLTADAIRALAQDGEIYLVAHIHTFRDLNAGNARIGTLMNTRGRNWYDQDGFSWTSPASQPVADYLCALCLELADMGFDEILLDDAGYPCKGNLSALATDEKRPEIRTDPVAAFYARLSGELKEKDVRLSVRAYETLLPGEEVYSGMTAAVLAENVDRVWLDKGVDREHYQAILTTAGLDSPETRIVSPASASAEGSWYK